MFKKIFTLITAMIISASLVACNGNEDKENKIETEDNTKIKIVTSINPLRDFAEAVGGDKVEVSLLVPEGVEAHDYEPKARDIEQLAGADIFVYNGVGMESWLDQVLQTVANKKNLVKIDSSAGVNLLNTEGEEHHHEDEEEVDHNHGEFDPHIWLSLIEAKQQTLNIKEALIVLDEKNKDFYEENYKAFIVKLDDLYQNYKEKFDTVNNKYFITGHEAFGYLCRDFNLIQKSITGLRAEGEPTPQALKKLVDLAKENEIKVVFTEKQAAPEVSETIAREIGVKVESLYSIEAREDGMTYLEMMELNLERIYNALK